MIGDRIRKIRVSKQMTQDDLAKLIRVPRYVISNYERNHSEPDMQALRDLSRALNISCDYLLGIKIYHYRCPFKNWSEEKKQDFKREVYKIFGIDLDKE